MFYHLPVIFSPLSRLLLIFSPFSGHLFTIFSSSTDLFIIFLVSFCCCCFFVFTISWSSFHLFLVFYSSFYHFLVSLLPSPGHFITIFSSSTRLFTIFWSSIYHFLVIFLPFAPGHLFTIVSVFFLFLHVPASTCHDVRFSPTGKREFSWSDKPDLKGKSQSVSQPSGQRQSSSGLIGRKEPRPRERQRRQQGRGVCQPLASGPLPRVLTSRAGHWSGQQGKSR